MKLIRNVFRCKKGAAMVEYALLVAGIALVTAASVSVLGHKTNDMVGTVAAILPGAHADDNGPIAAAKLIETTPGSSSTATPIGLDAAAIAANGGTERLGNNLGVPNLGTELIIEVPTTT